MKSGWQAILQRLVTAPKVSSVGSSDLSWGLADVDQDAAGLPSGVCECRNGLVEELRP